MYRHDAARCHALAGAIDPATSDSYFNAARLVVTCAVKQGDSVAALAMLDDRKRAYATDPDFPSVSDPALNEAILLAQLNRYEEVPGLLKGARRSLQTAIDSGNEFPEVWLRMASAQRLAGETDAAYATLEHAFSLGLTVNNRNHWDLEFVPFEHDARFQSLRAKSVAYVVEQREKIAAQLANVRPETPVAPVGTH